MSRHFESRINDKDGGSLKVFEKKSYKNGVVSSKNPLSTEEGIEFLKNVGNADDCGIGT